MRPAALIVLVVVLTPSAATKAPTPEPTQQPPKFCAVRSAELKSFMRSSDDKNCRCGGLLLGVVPAKVGLGIGPPGAELEVSLPGLVNAGFAFFWLGVIVPIGWLFNASILQQERAACLRSLSQWLVAGFAVGFTAFATCSIAQMIPDLLAGTYSPLVLFVNLNCRDHPRIHFTLCFEPIPVPYSCATGLDASHHLQRAAPHRHRFDLS